MRQKPAVRRRRQKPERATSFNSTEPPTTSRARLRRLPLEGIKPSLPSRPLQRLTPLSHPRPQTRLLLHRPLPCFIYLCSSFSKDFVNSHISTCWVYSEHLLVDSANGLCDVNIYLDPIVSCLLLFQA